MENLFSSVGQTFAFHAGFDEIGATAGRAEFFAGSFDAQALADGAVAETTGHAVVEEIKVVVFKLDDLSAINTDEMIVGRAVEEVGVVGLLAVAELDFVNEFGFVEQGESAVDGGSGSRRPC